MRPDKEEINYKNLFSKNEEFTDIPEFEDILNLPSSPKNHSGKSARVKSFIMIVLILLTGLIYFRSKTPKTAISKNGMELVQDKKSLVWEWTSPTQQLLSTSFSNTFTNFNMPTDFLSLKNISLQTNNNLKSN
jgi:hypothetical protein